MKMPTSEEKITYCEKMLEVELQPWQKQFIRDLDKSKELRDKKERAFFAGVDAARGKDKTAVLKVDYSGETARIVAIDEWDSFIHNQHRRKSPWERFRAALSRAAEKIWGWAE